MGKGAHAPCPRSLAQASRWARFALPTLHPSVPAFSPMFPSIRDCNNGFASQLMLKDLRLAQQTALSCRSAALRRPSTKWSARHGELDCSTIQADRG